MAFGKTREKMEEEWRPIVETPQYHISNHGRVLNEKFGRILALSENQKGIVYVGLLKKGVQCKRGVASLVANAFLHRPRYSTFTHVINKDGDRHNNFASNLDWRPLWYVWKYHAQFRNREGHENIPIADMDTGEEFISVWDAAVKYGLLVSDILEAINNQTHVWPTGQRFWRMD